MYENTQDYFAQQGISEIILYRGSHWSNQADVPNGLGLDIHQKDMTVIRTTEYQTQPMSSFSADPSTAISFSTSGFYQNVIATKIPVRDIIGSSLTGYGSLIEIEFVVLARPHSYVSAISNNQMQSMRKGTLMNRLALKSQETQE